MKIKQLEIKLNNLYKEKDKINEILLKNKEDIKFIKSEINSIRKKEKEILHDKKLGYSEKDIFNANKSFYDELTNEQITIFIEELQKNIHYNTELSELKKDIYFAKKIIYIFFSKREIIEILKNTKKIHKYRRYIIFKLAKNIIRYRNEILELDRIINNCFNSRQGGYAYSLKILNELREINKSL